MISMLFLLHSPISNLDLRVSKYPSNLPETLLGWTDIILRPLLVTLTILTDVPNCGNAMSKPPKVQKVLYLFDPRYFFVRIFRAEFNLSISLSVYGSFLSRLAFI